MKDVKDFLEQMSKPNIDFLAPSLQEILLNFKFNENKEINSPLIAFSELDLIFTHVEKDEEHIRELLNTYHKFYTEAITVIGDRAADYLHNNVPYPYTLILRRDVFQEQQISKLINTISNILKGEEIEGIVTKYFLNDEEPKKNEHGDKFIMLAVCPFIMYVKEDNKFTLPWECVLTCWEKVEEDPSSYKQIKFTLLFV